jgi:hypothetical protein
MAISTFECIPALNILDLAMKASVPGAVPDCAGGEITAAQRLEYLTFGLGVCQALHDVDYDILRLGLSEIVEIAKGHAGFVEYDMFAESSGVVDTARLVACQQKQVFYVRFAHGIAAALK